MSLPPYGYDDESVIPKERVTQFIKRLETELGKIEKLFATHASLEGKVDNFLKNDLWLLRSSCDELGSDFHILGEHLAYCYTQFFENPTREHFELLRQDVEKVKRLLGLLAARS